MTADDNLDVLRFRDIFFYVRKLFYLAWVELDINFFSIILRLTFTSELIFPPLRGIYGKRINFQILKVGTGSPRNYHNWIQLEAASN